MKSNEVLEIKSRAIDRNSHFNCQIQCRNPETVLTGLPETKLSDNDYKTCGASPRALINHKIINGQSVAHPGMYPWQVILTHSNVFFCGGALISPTWILTAGK